MRNAREELQLVDGVRQSLATLRRRAEMLPEGHGVRVSVETCLRMVEKQTDDEIDALHESISSRHDA